MKSRDGKGVTCTDAQTTWQCKRSHCSLQWLLLNDFETAIVRAVVRLFHHSDNKASVEWRGEVKETEGSLLDEISSTRGYSTLRSTIRRGIMIRGELDIMAWADLQSTDKGDVDLTSSIFCESFMYILRSLPFGIQRDRQPGNLKYQQLASSSLIDSIS